MRGVPHPSSVIPLGGLACDGHGLQLPAVETIPAELVGGPNLVGEAERVDPAFLFRPPPAIPGELDHARLPAALDHCRPDEIGTARTRVHPNAIHHPFRMGMQQMGDESDDLDPRGGAHQRDGGHIGARREGEDVALEAIGRAGPCEDVGVDLHGRNISGDRGRLATSTPRKETKLTGKSTLERQGGLPPW